MKYILTDLKKKTIPSLGKTVLDCTATDLHGNAKEVSIWREQKDNSIFPNFDTLAENAEIEGNEWINPKTNKVSIYPPKDFKNSPRKFPPKGNMSEVMKRKEDSIERFQDSKELSIRYASTFRAATDIVVEKLKADPNLDWQKEWELVRQWFSENWSNITAEGLTSDGNKVPF